MRTEIVAGVSKTRFINAWRRLATHDLHLLSPIVRVSLRQCSPGTGLDTLGVRGPSAVDDCDASRARDERSERDFERLKSASLTIPVCHVIVTGAPRFWASRTGLKLCNNQQSHRIPPTPSPHPPHRIPFSAPAYTARITTPIPFPSPLPWHSATCHATPSPSVPRPRTVRSPSWWSSSRTRRARAGRGRRGMRGSLRGGRGRRTRLSYMVSLAPVVEEELGPGRLSR